MPLSKGTLNLFIQAAWNKAVDRKMSELREPAYSATDTGVNPSKAMRILVDLRTYVDRVISLFYYLVPPTATDEDNFYNHLNILIKEIADLAFDQHYFDPQHLVSHDFWHGVAVGELMQGALQSLSDDYKLVLEKDLKKNTARFAAVLGGMLHDIGYPIQDKLKLVKASHAPIGAGLLMKSALHESLTTVLACSHRAEVAQEMGVDLSLSERIGRVRTIDQIGKLIARHGCDKSEPIVHSTADASLLMDVQNLGGMLVDTDSPGYQQQCSLQTHLHMPVDQWGGTTALRVYGVSVANQPDHLHEERAKRLSDRLIAKYPDIAFWKRRATKDFTVEARHALTSADSKGAVNQQKFPVSLEENIEEALVRIADNAHEVFSRLSCLQRHGIFIHAWLKLEGLSGVPVKGQIEGNDKMNHLSGYVPNRFNEVICSLKHDSPQLTTNLITSLLLTPSNYSNSEKVLLNEVLRKLESDNNKYTAADFKAAVFECALQEYQHYYSAEDAVDSTCVQEMRDAFTKAHLEQGRHYIGCYPLTKSRIEVDKALRNVTVVYAVDDRMVDVLNQINIMEEGEESIPLGIHKLRRAAGAYETITSYGDPAVTIVVELPGGHTETLASYIQRKQSDMSSISNHGTRAQHHTSTFFTPAFRNNPAISDAVLPVVMTSSNIAMC